MAENGTRNGDAGRASPLFIELGSSGLRHNTGYIREELLRDLEGVKGIRIYKQMANDDILGAVLFANETLIRQVEWQVQAADATPLSVEHAALVDGMLFSDMSQSWPMFLSEALSMQVFGWAYHEICWKRRLGSEPPRGYVQDDPAWAWWAPSQYEDGLIGLRKLPIRAQDTLLRWDLDKTGGLRGMVQQDPNVPGIVTIPIEKALLFRIFNNKGNPEGKSLLRSAYEDWYFKRHIKRIEGIGIERDLAGLPVAGVPPQILAASADEHEKAMLAYVKSMVTSIRQDEQGGIVWPLAYDENGHLMFDLKLLSTGSTRQFDTSAIIARYDTRMLQTTLSNILMVGMQGVGTQALGETLSDLYTAALRTLAGSMTDVINRHLLPKVWALNALPRETMPMLVHGRIKPVDFDRFTAGVLRLSQAGIALTPQDEAHIRMEIGFPEMTEAEQVL